MNSFLKKLALVSLIFLWSCSDDSMVIEEYQLDSKDTLQEEAKDYSEFRNVYFGDLHVHTRYSFDAFLLGSNIDPDSSYKFAQGNALVNSWGVEMKLKEPLDFYAVTDHGMFLGMASEWADPNSMFSKFPESKPFHNINSPENLNDNSILKRIQLFRGNYGKFLLTQGSYWNTARAWFTNNRALASKGFDYDTHLSAWHDTTKAAERYNDPGKFTTFIAYEWTVSSPLPESASYHRNIIFESSKAPKRPFTRLDSINPEDLWTWMDSIRKKGVDSIAIPHNPNQSNGETFKMDYFNGMPVDKKYSELRMRNEPIVEITQIKGTSETHPKLSPEDKWADFEILNTRKGNVSQYSLPSGSYVREALINGLALKSEDRGNPFEIGFIGSSDTHNGAFTFDEENYFGASPLSASPVVRGSVPLSGPTIDMVENLREVGVESSQEKGLSYGNMRSTQFGASGLAAVWAEQNTRKSIFSALRRKETYATSGTKIRLRFFGGYGLDSFDLNNENLIEQAYKSGVPMGGNLLFNNNLTPSFLILAQQDVKGAPLQRIQMIKGWYDSGYAKETREKVYDIACSDGLKVDPKTHRCPDNRASVNLSDCSISANKGASELKVIWEDPDFDPQVESVYYVRVLENPVCRWSTWDALREGVKPRKKVQPTIQERAWSSPIWYKTINQ